MQNLIFDKKYLAILFLILRLDFNDSDCWPTHLPLALCIKPTKPNCADAFHAGFTSFGGLQDREREREREKVKEKVRERERESERRKEHSAN